MSNDADLSSMAGVPTRTPLLAVRPIGLGTSAAESVNSYLLRLAAYNDRAPAWLYGKPPDDALEWRRAIPCVYHDTHVYLMTSPMGKKLTSVLTDHTGVPEVEKLSWHHPECSVDVKGFFDRPLKWCPHCLSEDETPYFRVLWQLHAVAVCAKHRVRLLARCPRCSKEVAQLGEFHGVHECRRCRTSLTVVLPDAQIAATDAEIYVADQGADLVAAASGETLDWTRIAPFEPLMHAARLQGAAGVTRASTLLGIEHSTLIGWRAGKNTSLAHVFNACCLNGLPVLPVLRGEFCTPGSRRGSLPGRPPRPPRTRIKAAALRAAVLELLDAKGSKPLSITTMAQRLNVHRERIEDVCPEAVERSRAAIADYWAARRAEFEQELKGRVNQAIEDMKRAREPMRRYRLLKRFTTSERCTLIEFSDYVMGALRSAEAAVSAG